MEKKPQNKKWIILVGAAVLLALVVLLVIIFGGKSDAKALEEQLALGSRYLEEMDFERAMAAYQEALRIDPKNEEAYIGLADAYVGMGDYESALAILETGYGEVASEDLAAKREEVERAYGLWQEEQMPESQAPSESTQEDGAEEEDVTEDQAAQPEHTIARIVLEELYEEYDAHAVITAYDANDDVVWIYETPQYDLTELNQVDGLVQTEDRFYFVQSGTVVALDLQTGAVVWENSDFGGAGVSSTFDKKAIYLCGYYGPDFYAISYDGDTLMRIDQFDPAYFWPYQIKLTDGRAAVYMGGPEDAGDSGTPAKIFYVDLETYEMSAEDGVSGDAF